MDVSFKKSRQTMLCFGYRRRSRPQLLAVVTLSGQCGILFVGWGSGYRPIVKLTTMECGCCWICVNIGIWTLPNFSRRFATKTTQGDPESHKKWYGCPACLFLAIGVFLKERCQDGSMKAVKGGSGPLFLVPFGFESHPGPPRSLSLSAVEQDVFPLGSA